MQRVSFMYIHFLSVQNVIFFCSSVPRIPWAFAMTELCGMILCYIWLLVLLLHKHRYLSYAIKRQNILTVLDKVHQTLFLSLLISFFSHYEKCFGFDQQESHCEVKTYIFSSILNIFCKDERW